MKMKYEVETKVTLTADNGKKFGVGQDIAFDYKGSHYIGKIKRITDTTITIEDIVVDKVRKDGELEIPLYDIKADSCAYVYCD